MNTVQTKQGGFTIIEVVLVLAIAGLIFLMVFIALPALQRNQRDQQRRDDVARTVGQLQSYATNNRGDLPDNADFTEFVTDYLKTGDNEFKNPETGTDYSLAEGVNSNGGTGTIQYSKNAQCSGENMQTGGGVRQAAVRVQLESGGYFCQSVQG